MERDGPSTWRELPVIDAERGAGSESAPRTASELRQRLLRAMLRTVGDYGLIADGDRILVAVSGGKDSATLLDLLEDARKRAPIRYELVAFHLDQAQPGHDPRPLAEWLETLGVEWHVHREDTYSAVLELARARKTSYCAPCSSGDGALPPMAWLRRALGPALALLTALALAHGLVRWARLRSARSAPSDAASSGPPDGAAGGS